MNIPSASGMNLIAGIQNKNINVIATPYITEFFFLNINLFKLSNW